MVVFQYKKKHVLTTQPSRFVFVSIISTILSLFISLPLRAQDSSSTGMASFYSNQLHGRKTASGEKYNKYKFTAAHRTLPLGTSVKVTNLKNGKSVVVEINDRGPYAKKRLIDLSYAAAREINMIQEGITPVLVQEIDSIIDSESQSPLKKQPRHLKPGLYYSPELNNTIQPKGYSIQIGSFTLYENARTRMYELKNTRKVTSVYIRFVKIHHKTYYRVLCDGFEDEQDAINKQTELTKLGYECFILPEKN